MSSFQLPPLGFDPLQKPKWPLPEPLAGTQGPEGLGLPGSEGTDTAAPESSAFAGVLEGALDHVRELQGDVQAKTRGMVLGEGVELHDVMLAADKSEVSFNLLLEVRNKMIDAWEKLSRAAV